VAGLQGGENTDEEGVTNNPTTLKYVRWTVNGNQWGGEPGNGMSGYNYGVPGTGRGVGGAIRRGLGRGGWVGKSHWLPRG